MTAAWWWKRLTLALAAAGLAAAAVVLLAEADVLDPHTEDGRRIVMDTVEGVKRAD